MAPTRSARGGQPIFERFVVQGPVDEARVIGGVEGPGGDAWQPVDTEAGLDSISTAPLQILCVFLRRIKDLEPVERGF